MIGSSLDGQNMARTNKKQHWIPVLKLRFDGARFREHGIELSALPEVWRFQEIIVALAKELWHRDNPRRKRLPRGFEDAIRLRFRKVESGSAVLPLEGLVDKPQEDLFQKPYTIRAVDLAYRTVASQDIDGPLPGDLPRNITPLFADWGKDLAKNETIGLTPPRRKRTNYTEKKRARFTRFIERHYVDVVALTGEVRAADLNGCNFTVRLDDGANISGKFEPYQESSITEALRHHQSCRLRLRGRAEFVREGQLRKILHVEEVTVVGVGEAKFDTSARPIWEVAEELGQRISTREWAKVPSDLSQNIDYYLYGAPKRE